MDQIVQRKKPFTWSYSRLKNFEICPRRHQQIDLQKNYRDQSDALDWGETVHKAAAQRLGSAKEFTEELELLEPWCKKIEAGGGKILVEQKLAITKDFKATSYFAPNVWFRSVADVVQLKEDVAGVYDWKTGKIIDDSVQLALCAQCVFAHHPNIKKLRAVFIWLKENEITTKYFTPDDMPELWDAMRERVALLKNAYDTDTYPPIHNKYCRRWCPVETCEFHGVSYWD